MITDKPYLFFSGRTPGTASMIIKRAAAMNNEFFKDKTLEFRREETERLAQIRPVPPNINATVTDIAGVNCEWICTNSCKSEQVILYLHGGSWAFGNLKTAKSVGILLAETTGFKVLVVEYRLAPEHPYPCALNDCFDVYTQLLNDGTLPHNMALFGDSAGGNLALCMLSKLRDDGIPLPTCAGLASPATDLTNESQMYSLMPDYLLTNYGGKQKDAISMYIGDNDRKHPYISPKYADFGGFPPLLIHAGGDEELAIDIVNFAHTVYLSGQSIKLKIWNNMFHDFTIVGLSLKQSRKSLKEFGQFFTAHLTKKQTSLLG